MATSGNSSQNNAHSSGWKISISVFILLLIGAVGIGLWITKKSDIEVQPASRQPLSSPAAKATPESTVVAVFVITPTPAEIKVYVTGAVKNPGVYKMQPGDRIEDALKAAGGAGDEADLLNIDLAKRVVDEMQIVVPLKAIASPIPGTSGPAAGGVTIPAGTTTGAGQSGKINVNTATAADLDKLPGIGQTLSTRIVEYRTAHGSYRNLDDLRKVAGLTNSVIEKIKDSISF